MSDNPESNDERPCLHCLIADLIDEFYAEYGSLSGEKDTLDVEEIISALAKTVAEMTYGSDASARQRIVDDLIREISSSKPNTPTRRARRCGIDEDRAVSRATPATVRLQAPSDLGGAGRSKAKHPRRLSPTGQRFRRNAGAGR